MVSIGSNAVRPCLHCLLMKTLNEYLAEHGPVTMDELAEDLNAFSLEIILNIANLSHQEKEQVN